MRSVTSLLIAMIIVATLAGPGDATQYLNRRLLECDPLTYVVEPLEIIGGTLHLSEFWSNEYGDCTGLTPGPPFIIEMGVTIRNERNPDGSVLEWGNLIVSNQYAAMGPMKIQVQDGAALICYGPVEAHGGIGTPVIFTGSGHTSFPRYAPAADTAEFERNFTYCNFTPGAYSHDNACDIFGGHVTLENCTFGPTDGHLGLNLHSAGDVVLRSCTFDRTSMRTANSPNIIQGVETLDIDGLRFNNCQIPYNSTVSAACMSINMNVVLKGLRNITGSNNTHDWITFGGLTTAYIKDSCTIQTSHDFPVVFLEYVIVDTNAVLSLESGSIIQLGSFGDKIIQRANSRMILDESVITSYADKAYGIYQPGLSTDVPNESHFWDGIEMEPGSSLEVKNNSVIRWSYAAIEGSGNVTIDHSKIEQHWGRVIQIRPTSPCSLSIAKSTIGPALSQTSEALGFILSTDPSDSASGYVNIDSTIVTKSGNNGIYIGGGEGRSPDIDYSVRITNSVISGNGDNGLWGQMGPPADSIVIMNNTFIGNGGVGCYLNDAGCDSMSVRMENNVALGNGGTGLGAKTGFVDIVGNSSLYNGGTGISYAQRPQRLGYIANNIMAYNDGRGLYCNAKYGGVVPTLAHNIVWSNNALDDDLLFTSDDFEVYTMAELHALGGVGLTNDEVCPELRPTVKAPVRSHRFNQATAETEVFVGGSVFIENQLKGMAVLPTQRDSTAWFYVTRNTEDSVFIARDIRSVAGNGDTMTFYDFHLTQISPAIGFGDTDYVSTEFDVDGDERVIDADSNGTALVDAGGDEFNPDSSYLPNVMVLSPKADTTLVPGEIVVVAWYAPGMHTVNIDYTYDIPLGGDPSAWYEVIHNHPTTMPIHLWTVPTVLSSRCKVRVADASDPTKYVISDIFHIKDVRLTRFAADSSYEFYQPSQHGWSYTNDSSYLWPFSAWEQINYETGTDPYTGRLYPYDDPAYRFGVNEDEYYPSWPLWVETFGTDQCYNATPAGMMYVLRAVYEWSSCCGTWEGSCAGLATSALLAFGNSNLLEPRWGHLNLPANTHQAAINDDIREYINVMHTAQFGKFQQEYFDGGYNIALDTTLKRIREHLLDTERDDACVTIGGQDKQGAHSLLPYAMVGDPDPSKVRVMVYDPNEPGNDNLFIAVDTTADTWLYSEFPEWAGAHNFYYDYPVKSIIDYPELNKTGLAQPAIAADITTDSLIKFLYTKSADLKLFSYAGDSIGFNDSGLFNSIGEGEPLIPLDVHPARPFGFLLPNQEYYGTIGNPEDSVLRAECYYDSLYVGYRRVCTDSTETDHFRVFDGLTYYNLDSVAKSVQFTAINTLPDRERSIVVLGYDVGAGDTVTIEPLADSAWYLSNHGNGCEYGLWFREVSSAGESRFYSEQVSIDSGQAHIIAPRWSSFNRDSCWVYVDSDNDYVADDSMVLVTDIVVGVEDEPGHPLPLSFELSQNYPNPFNPVTTIEYNLPTRSRVTIDIFNVLGQRVRTLVDREEAAGSYRITWNGTNSSGRAVSTGVYLYRFRAGEQVETKKMLLLR